MWFVHGKSLSIPIRFYNANKLLSSPLKQDHNFSQTFLVRNRDFVNETFSMSVEIEIMKCFYTFYKM